MDSSNGMIVRGRRNVCGVREHGRFTIKKTNVGLDISSENNYLFANQ